jgi:hypothetical protein
LKIDSAASPAEIALTCRRLQAEALEWIAGQRGGVVAKFDGSLGSLIRFYQSEPLSNFANIKHNTRHTYTQMFAILDRHVGQRNLTSLSARDFDRWYKEFRKPACAGGPERISRAHYLLNLCRMLFKFGVRMEIHECERLSAIISTMSFENSRPRTSLLTYEMAKAFCVEARRCGRLSLALATAIQFECALRQRDVIGEWLQLEEQGKGHGANGKRWTTGLIWGEHISRELILNKPTSKSRGQERVIVDLKGCPLVMEQLKYLPPERRVGAVIVSETTGKQYFPDAFCTNWRAIARRAGIPDDVWSMDARAGAVTEATEANVPLEHVRSLTTHKGRMVQRYDRATQAKNDQVIALRVASRRVK